MSRFYFLGVWILIFIIPASSQQTWSLLRCVEHARANSIAIKQNNLRVDQAEVSAIQARHSQYPRFNGSSSYGLNFGRTINPVTNDFETSSIGNNSVGVNAGVTLFNGGFIRNSISQSLVDVQTAKLDADQFSQDLSLNVVQFYIAILFAQDRLDNARIQVQTTTQQLDQVDKLIAAGSRPEGDRLEILAQQAREEQNIIVFQNTVLSNKLSLKQLLRLQINEPFDIERPAANSLQPSLIDQDLAQIYTYALENRSDVKSGDLKIKSAEFGVKIQKANYLPSISLGGNLNSLFSSRGIRVIGIREVENKVKINFNGQIAELGLFSDRPITEKNPYFTQLNENVGYGLGLSASIPIYNNYRARAGVRQAEITVEGAKLNNDQTKENIKNNIQTALNDLSAAANSYEAAKRSTVAQRLAYNNTKTKFDVGSANTFELLTAKNRLDIAVTEELVAQYDYIFRTKVIDYYLGKTITLN